MATIKITSNSEGIRRGALAALEALRHLEASTEIVIPEQTAEGYYAQIINDCHTLVASFGPMTPEQEGAFTVLAEYIHMSNSTGLPNLEPGGWKPIASMTEEELRDEIAETEADMLT